MDNEGTYTFEFNTGGNTGNLDIGWNAYLDDLGKPVPLTSGFKSSDKIYPYFGLYEIKLDNYDFDYVDSYEFEYVESEFSDSGYRLFGDSFFSSYCSDVNLNYSGYSCSCERSNHGYDKCKHRHVLLSLVTDEQEQKEYNFKSADEEYATMIYISDGKPTGQQINDVITNIYKANNNYEFTLVKNTKFKDGTLDKHGYWYLDTKKYKLPLSKSSYEYIYKNPSKIDIDSYEENLYQECLWGNTEIGRWYPSDDITLIPVNNNLNLEFNFNNGDTIYNNNKLLINYSQSYAACSHNLYNCNWETRSVYHPAEGYYNTIYDNDLYDYHSEWVETKPSWTENIRKYYFDCNRNYITNNNFSKQISK